MSFNRNQFIAIAKNLINTNYVLHSYYPPVGLDCATFIHYCLLGANYDEAIDIPILNPDFGLHKESTEYLDKMNDYFTSVKQPLKGDLILLKFGRSYSHAGIVIDDDKFIHCAMNIGVKINDIELNRDSLFFRVKG